MIVSILENILNPPLLFFILGLIAVGIKSDLEIPPAISKALSLYLLFSIGYRGGVELSHSVAGTDIYKALGAALLVSFLTPLYVFQLAQKRLNIYDSGAIAATYGSISAITFITATVFLQSMGISFGGYMIAAMALMESPSILMGVLLVRMNEKKNGKESTSIKEVIHESLTNGSVVLILGSLAIGWFTGEKFESDLSPFTNDLFKGVLTIFLLDMGILAGRRIRPLFKRWRLVLLFGLLLPIFNAMAGVGLTYLLNLNTGDALLLTILMGSASYIAVPAAFKMAVPQANPGIYIPLSIGVTFPFNIIIGIPVYFELITLLG